MWRRRTEPARPLARFRGRLARPAWLRNCTMKLRCIVLGLVLNSGLLGQVEAPPDASTSHLRTICLIRHGNYAGTPNEASGDGR